VLLDYWILNIEKLIKLLFYFNEIFYFVNCGNGSIYFTMKIYLCSYFVFRLTAKKVFP